jgi:hypothetical protein
VPEVRAKKLANRPGSPPPNIDAPGTRFDVNYYSSGPTYISDVGVSAEVTKGWSKCKAGAAP